ncbi:MAG: hypothetical protein ACM3SY_06700 [Candidatus Omnitrophota bacterium]
MEYVPIWARDIRREGVLEGKREAAKEISERLLNHGLKIEAIARYLDMTVEEVNQLTERTH